MAHGPSMQTTSLQFLNYSNAQVRPIAWQVLAAFDKTLDPSIDFFTLDSSLLDGPDILAPSDNNVIQEWDKYTYTDYSSRVISIETNREVTEPSSIVQSYADVTLNNYDNYFTPNSGSPIDQFILPKRPFRLLMGFGNETVPVFVGLSEKMPTLDKTSRTASFHLIDFLSIIFEKDIGNTEILLDNTTTEILDVLFQAVGLLPAQYELDNSFNTIPFFYVNKGDKLGPIVKELMEAEQGRLYLDEQGVIRFRNRQNYATDTVYNFSKTNTLDYSVSDDDDIINYAKLKLNILEVQPEQSVYEQSVPIYVPAGDTVEIFANLNDPATSVTTPVYSPVSVESSHFITTQDIEGLLAYTDISLATIDKFSTAVKLTFENTGTLNGYVYAVDLWGTPVKQVDTILIEEKDQASIDEFEERVYELDTKYIQTKSNGITKAAIMVDDYKDYGSMVELEVKGNPALQIDDGLNLNLDGYQGTHVITKIINGISDGRYRQRITAKFKEPRLYFILDQSLLDGTDVLAP